VCSSDLEEICLDIQLTSSLRGIARAYSQSDTLATLLRYCNTEQRGGDAFRPTTPRHAGPYLYMLNAR